jgi:hypothetical protein
VYLVVSALVRDHYINAAVVADAGSVCNTCITPRVLGLLLSCCVDSASLSLSLAMCWNLCWQLVLVDQSVASVIAGALFVFGIGLNLWTLQALGIKGLLYKAMVD